MAGTNSKGKSLFKNISSILSDKRVDIALIAVIIVFAFIVRYIGLMDSGLTWDEPATIKSGMLYGHDIETLNFNSSYWFMESEHGPVSKYFYGIALGIMNHRVLDFSGFEIARMVDVLMSVLTCVLVYLIGVEFYNRRIAFLSALTLSLIPTFLAHSQIAAVDMPVALFFTLTMYLFLLAVKYKNVILFVASAISLGLLIDVKFNGLLAIPVMLIFFVVHRYMNRPQSADADRGKSGHLSGALDRLNYYLPLISIICFAIVTIVTIFVIWPWLWTDPIGNLERSLSHWSYVPMQYFLGQYQQAPFYYYVVYFLVTTPALLLVPLAFGIWYAARSKDPFKIAVLLWFAIPFFYGFSGFIQDGMRYILMIYPALAIIAAEGIAYLASIAKMRLNLSHGGERALSWTLGAILIAYLLIVVISVHPYYLDYYNELSGGTQNVYDHRLFNLGEWGEGQYEAAMYIDSIAKPGTTVYAATIPSHLYMYYGKNLTYLTPYFTGYVPDKNITLEPDSDFVIVNYPFVEYNNVTFDTSRYKLVYSSKVQGVPIVDVYEKKS